MQQDKSSAQKEERYHWIWVIAGGGMAGIYAGLCAAESKPCIKAGYH